jgi:hypothetical protein
MKVLLWIYAVTGSLYWLADALGNQGVTRYVDGNVLWFFMNVAPVVLIVLIIVPWIQHIVPHADRESR